MSAKTFHTHHDLPKKTRQQVIQILNQHLADTSDLFSIVKTAHWNVKGPTFIALHELFDKLAEELEDQADTIAERAVAMGGVAVGTVRQAAAATRLSELPLGDVDGMALVRALVDRYSTLAKATREAIDTTNGLGDAGTGDLFTAVSRELDKSMWFLEAHLQAK